MPDPDGAIAPVTAEGRGPASVVTRNLTTAGCCLAMLLSVACSGTPMGDHDAAAGGPATLSVTSVPLSSKLLAPPDFAAVLAESGRVMINVHVPDEGDIEGTDLSIPFDQIDVSAPRLPADPTTLLAIYCRTGRMSAVAARTLSRLGYSNIVELDGGMQAWAAAGGFLVPHRPPP